MGERVRQLQPERVGLALVSTAAAMTGLARLGLAPSRPCLPLLLTLSLGLGPAALTRRGESDPAAAALNQHADEGNGNDTHWPLPYSATCSPFDSCGNHRFLATWAPTPTAMATPIAMRVLLQWRRPWFGPAPSVVLGQLLHPKPGASDMISNVLILNATRTAGVVVFDPANASAPGVRLYFLPFSHGHSELK